MVGIKWESQGYIFSQVKFSLLQTVQGPPTPSHPGEFGSDFNTSLIGLMNIHSPPDDWSSLHLKELQSSWGQEDVDIMIHNVYYTITHGSLMLFPRSFVNKYQYMTTTTSSCCVNSKNDYNKDEDQNDDDGERAAPLHRIPRVDACFGRLPIHCFCSSHFFNFPPLNRRWTL